VNILRLLQMNGGNFGAKNACGLTALEELDSYGTRLTQHPLTARIRAALLAVDGATTVVAKAENEAQNGDAQVRFSNFSSVAAASHDTRRFEPCWSWRFGTLQFGVPEQWLYAACFEGETDLVRATLQSVVGLDLEHQYSGVQSQTLLFAACRGSSTAIMALSCAMRWAR